MAEVRVLINAGIDDHARPDHPLWRSVVPVWSQVAIWLYEDADPQFKDHLPEAWEDQPDDVAGGGSDWYGDEDSWQVQVLTELGYATEPVGG